MANYVNITTITASTAIILNLFLIFIIIYFKNANLGSFKWALVLLAAFEASFAIDLVLAPPYFVVMNGTWMAFSFGTPVSDTIMSYFASLVYCSLHQIWVGIIAALFIYRYIVICRNSWLTYLEIHKPLKYLIGIFYIAHVLVALWCGILLCEHDPMSEDIRLKVINVSGLSVPKNIDYLALNPKYLAGYIGYVNHIFVYYGSVPIYAYCGISMYRKIKQASKIVANRDFVELQRKMFYLVLIQTMTPLMLANLPFLVVLTFPLWPEDIVFNSTSEMIPLLTTLPKIVDPIAIIFFVPAYRKATASLFGCGSKQPSSVQPSMGTTTMVESGLTTATANQTSMNP